MTPEAWWQARIDSGTHVTCHGCRKRILGRHWRIARDGMESLGVNCLTCDLKACGVTVTRG